MNTKNIHLIYYAALREARGLDHEFVQTQSKTARDLYRELQKEHHFKLSDNSLKVSVNDTLSAWETSLNDGDQVVFIPPVSGG